MKPILPYLATCLLTVCLSARAAETSTRPLLPLQRGDHVALIGNALPDRFQHSGWLETFILSELPEHDLVFRNLAIAGDEVRFRHRPENFGSADEWLKKTGADVIFAFFGFNESFRGTDGLAGFRSDLDKFLKETAQKNYSGKAPPQVVLFSPIANERHPDPNFPEPSARNANLRQYTEAMKEVAAANGVPLVDLFGPSERLFADAAARKQSLTINGMHLTDRGDELLAKVIFKELFGKEFNSGRRQGALEKLRQAINDKNAQWHARYRTVDGNNVYGGRSALAYQPEKGGFISDRDPAPPYVSNFKILQQEMSQRDVMTANRDKRVWAVARGNDLKVDDSNLPLVESVRSNLKGPNADESFKFLGSEEAIGKMKVHSNMKVNLFAGEERFPELAKPVQMAWDTRGRLWVAAWPNYPERTPDSKVGDSLLVLEDTNGDGRADKCTHFIDDLNSPTGFQFYKDGVLLMQAPDLWFLRDTNNNGKADAKERVVMGLSSADSHHTANSICLDPGGAIYLSDGVFHRTQVETADGPVRNNDAAIYRFEPRSGKFETYISYDFANPHGRVFDYWGNDLVTDGTGNANYFGPAFSGRLDYPAKHPGMKQFWKRPSRPCPGTALLTSRHFPDEFQGNFLNCNVIGFQGIYRVKVSEQGSGLEGESLEDLVSSSDPNFRPTAVNVGPDGAIYFADWQNPIIGHMQHHLRDPNRDHEHGRIYRITYNGRPLMKPPRIDGRPIPALLELLKEPENQIRELAKVELGERDSAEVIAAVKKWMTGLKESDPAYEHHLAEALWVHQWHNIVNTDLLKRVLHSKDPRARAAAARVLCYWRDRVPDTLALLNALANDEHPRVRLEAVRAASFFTQLEAIDVALQIAKRPTDYYLDYTLQETLRQLKPIWRDALASGKAVADDNPAGRALLLRNVSTAELITLPRSTTILQAILTRPEAVDADRMVALGDLAKARQTTLLATLLAELDQNIKSLPTSADREASSSVTDAIGALARLLAYQQPEQLKAARNTLTRFVDARYPALLRQSAWAALALADDSFERVWNDAAKSRASQIDLLEGISLLTDSAFRAKAYAKVNPLLTSGSEAGTDGDRLQRAAIRAAVSMNDQSEAIFKALTDLIVKGQAVPAAAQGLNGLRRSDWPRAEAPRAAAGLVAWAKTISPGDRTSREYREIIQLAGDLAGLLPPEKAADLRGELKGLRVAAFIIRTVREQMRYDTPRLVVETAKPFEVLFENADFMPHNLLIVKPGAREKIGPTAAAMKPDALDSEGRSYVPDSPDILAATRMLQSGQQQALKLTAPAEESDCEYFCSFPGHHQVMWGRLIVTKDVDAYLQAHPEAPLPTPAAAGGSEEHAHGHAH